MRGVVYLVSLEDKIISIKEIVTRIENNLDYNDHISLMDYCTLCYYISNSNLFEDIYKAKYLSSGKEKLAYLIDHLNDYKLSMGLWTGYVGVGYLLNVYNDNNYEKILKKINAFIKYKTILLIKNTDFKREGVSQEYYDIFNGISCVGNYIIEFDNKDINYIEYTAKWISELVLEKESNLLFSGFHIPSKKIRNVHFKNQFNNGYVDLSLSHGVIGCLLFLTKSLRFHNLESVKDAIHLIVSEYLGFIDQSNILYYPTLLYLDDDNNLKRNNNIRCSWCYGILGVLRVLYLVTKKFKLLEENEIIIDCIIKISRLDLNRLDLICPTFCHGYSGVYHIYNEYFLDKIKFNSQFLNLLENKIWEFCNDKNLYLFQKFESNIEGNKLIKIDNRLSPQDGVISIIIPFILKYGFNGYDYFSKSLNIKL